MKKIKLFLVALLTCFCCVALSSCGLILDGLYLTAVLAGWALNEDRDAPTDEELRMPVEITEGAEIVEVTRTEDGYYLAKTVGAIKSLGDKDSDLFTFRLAYYDEYGYLLETLLLDGGYMGAGDTYKVEYEAELFYKPATARIYDVQLYAQYDYKDEKEAKEEVEILAGKSFTCTLGGDGLYHAVVTGNVKLIPDGVRDICIRIAFYDANGYLRMGTWEKQVNGPAERTFTVECTSDVEIVSYKVVYASTMYYSYVY